MAIFLFFGEDQWSLQDKLRFWQTEFEKKYGGDMNVVALQGKETSTQEILQTCQSLPFLSEKRFTVVKDFLSEGNTEEQKALAEKLGEIPEFCILVFSETKELPDRRSTLFKKLSKAGAATEFPALTGSKLLAWIEKTVTKKGGSIEREAILFLSELANGDLFRLENEIAKLAAYCGNNPITIAAIEQLMDTQLGTSIFRLTDGIGNKNAKLALSTLHQLMETGEEPHRILSMIMRQFRIIVSVKDCAENGARRDEIASKLREHPFVISNTLDQAKNFSAEQLRHAYRLLIDIDAKVKSGGIKILAGDNREFVLALDRLVVNLCK